MHESKAILVVSFGTSHQETREKTIDAIENDIRNAYPGWEVRKAYTSSVIIKKLLKRDEMKVDSVEEALKRLAADGFKKLVIQPTHVINGEEYDKLISICKSLTKNFDSMKTGVPLLSSTEDYKKVIHAIMDEFSDLAKDTALVLMGHGSAHFANAAYPAIDYMFKEQGYDNVFVGTVEGYPDLGIVQRKVRDYGAKKVKIAPLMVVAGDHATNDMAGEDAQSWKSVFEKDGVIVDTVLKGLGEYKKIRKIYVEHIADVI